MATQPLNSTPEIHHIPLKPPAELEALTIAPGSPLKLQREPEDVLAEAAKAAKALRALVESKPRKVVLNGKTFLQFEDWLTVARFYGVTVAARATNYVERGRVQGYECHAEAILVSTGQVIGAAQAECLDDEANWNMRAVYRDGRKVGEEKVPLFQLRSMAQTRAQAKALRSILSWVVVLAGYAPTPAEEMDGNTTERAIAPRMECKPIARDRVEKICAAIKQSLNIHELRARYISAGNEAKKFNDRVALDAFIQAKDARKRELQ